jgi:hypothetical protein
MGGLLIAGFIIIFYIHNLIALIYAKSLYLQRDYVRCFELL